MVQTELFSKIDIVIQTGKCPNCGRQMKYEEFANGDWSLTCKRCGLACGGHPK
jgi:ssDNA-binding Zn-finger/Zn-ribbon topoisomerase 1